MRRCVLVTPRVWRYRSGDIPWALRGGTGDAAGLLPHRGPIRPGNAEDRPPPSYRQHIPARRRCHRWQRRRCVTCCCWAWVGGHRSPHTRTRPQRPRRWRHHVGGTCSEWHRRWRGWRGWGVEVLDVWPDSPHPRCRVLLQVWTAVAITATSDVSCCWRARWQCYSCRSTATTAGGCG